MNAAPRGMSGHLTKGKKKLRNARKLQVLQAMRENYWPEIDAVATALLKAMTLTGEEIQRLFSDSMDARPDACLMGSGETAANAPGTAQRGPFTNTPRRSPRPTSLKQLRGSGGKSILAADPTADCGSRNLQPTLIELDCRLRN
jgi:hypothetical protein